MGRNIDTFNGFLQGLEAEWQPFARALSTPEERAAFTALITRARKLVAASTAQATPVRMDAFFMSLFVSLSMDVAALQKQVEAHEKEIAHLRGKP